MKNTNIVSLNNILWNWKIKKADGDLAKNFEAQTKQ